ncbi:MAG: TlpA family protein disulfide reductase [Acidobacteria bacterium]|nr:TlpA family protein disulfide reductase [Acidobacteriota bacterium]
MQHSFSIGYRTVWCLLLVAFAMPPVSAKDPDKFKPFKLKTSDGAAKTLQDFANKATLVGFFFPTCAYCNAALPEVQNIYEKYKDKGLSVVWINVLPKQNKLIPDWQEKHHLTIPVLIGASQEALQRDYRLNATPTHYLLDANGQVIFSQTGYKPGDEKALEAKIAETLNSAP